MTLMHEPGKDLQNICKGPHELKVINNTDCLHTWEATTNILIWLLHGQREVKRGGGVSLR